MNDKLESRRSFLGGVCSIPIIGIGTGAINDIVEWPTHVIKCKPMYIGAFSCHSWIKDRDGDGSSPWDLKPELWDLLEGADKVETLWKHWRGDYYESKERAIKALEDVLLKLNGKKQ